MSYEAIKLNSGKAISMNKKNKVIEGFLLKEVEIFLSKKSGDKGVIITFCSEDGKITKIFPPFIIRSTLLDTAEDGSLSVKEEYVNKMFRITWLEKVKLANGKTMNNFLVEIDKTKKLR